MKMRRQANGKNKSCLYGVISLPCFLALLACGICYGEDRPGEEGRQRYPEKTIVQQREEGSGLVLMGTIMEKTGTGAAIILVKSDGRQLLRRRGEWVDGAKLVEIHWDHVILDIGGSRYLLDMKETANYRMTPPSAEIDSTMQGKTGHHFGADSSEQLGNNSEEHLSPGVDPENQLIPPRIRMAFPDESVEPQRP